MEEAKALQGPLLLCILRPSENAFKSTELLGGLLKHRNEHASLNQIFNFLGAVFT